MRHVSNVIPPAVYEVKHFYLNPGLLTLQRGLLKVVNSGSNRVVNLKLRASNVAVP